MSNNQFSELRARARDPRDKALAQVRAEYEETLSQIAELEQRLAGKPSPDKQKLSAAVESVIPRVEQFCTADLLRSLETLDPGRVWPKSSVLRHMWWWSC
jgi:hypothetical protein